MSNTEQSNEMHPRAQPQQNPQEPQANEIVVDDTATLPTYSNFCRVTATPEEMLLDFGLNSQPFAPGRQDVKASQRVVVNFFTAKRLLSAIGMTIQRHEQTFGSIELDIRRRVGTPQPQLAQADAPVPNGQSEVIRLETVEYSPFTRLHRYGSATYHRGDAWGGGEKLGSIKSPGNVAIPFCGRSWARSPRSSSGTAPLSASDLQGFPAIERTKLFSTTPIYVGSLVARAV